MVFFNYFFFSSIYSVNILSIGLLVWSGYKNNLHPDSGAAVPPVRMAGRAVERELSVETDIPLEDDEDTYTRWVHGIFTTRKNTSAVFLAI